MITCERYDRACKQLANMECELTALRAKLAAAERERDAERAHNAVLRGALGRIVDLYNTPNALIQSVLREAESVLALTPSDSAARVAKLVDALETTVDVLDDQLGDGGHIPEFGLLVDATLEPWVSIFDAKRKAQAALAAWREWRGE